LIFLLEEKMLKLGKIKLGDFPKIAATISNLRLAFIKKAKEDGAQILELRLDELKKIDVSSIFSAVRIAKEQGMPVIATIRSKEEGGKKFISPQKRLQLFKMIIPEVDGIDVELSSNSILDSVVKFAHKFNKLAIVSYHNFAKTPSKEKLERIINESRKRKADIVKISTLVRTPIDILTLSFVTLKNKEKNIITLAMGRIGAISRIFFPVLGSLITYGFIDKPHAPGQLPVKILKRDLETYQHIV